MIDARRHKQVFNPDTFRFQVHIIGCGGMGSRIAEGLSRMGVGIKDQSTIHLYDADEFEAHNLTNQWTTFSRVGMKKVESTKSLMLEINPQSDIHCNIIRLSEFKKMSGVVFICVDSMNDRRTIIDKVLEDPSDVKCVIETRMDAGVGVTCCFDPNNKKQLDCWRLYWFPDTEADNMQGCGGYQSIISAIYATTAMALKQFEHFARTKSTANMLNRVYQDFDACIIRSESWSTT